MVQLFVVIFVWIYLLDLEFKNGIPLLLRLIEIFGGDKLGLVSNQVA